MVVINLKLKKKNILLATTVIVGLIIILLIAFSGSPKKAPVKNTSEQKEISLKGETNEERLKFLFEYGYETTGDAVETRDVVIPYDFDSTYIKYNNLQKKQGFNLKEYSGLRVTEYRYEITNYSDDSGTVNANIMVHKGMIIGGDVSSAKLDGFMHGFDKKLKLEE